MHCTSATFIPGAAACRSSPSTRTGRQRQPGAGRRDARTGAVLWSVPADRGTGRAVTGDIDAAHPGAESWAITADGV
ncbi:hypothetical protein ACLGIH_01055 [Streptomyces sp. HMX87]|uniref:rhamnogalacturonan lyase family protein n=1 Tax=Streptomyces sp. HMX87 TaxID=3390849 RepID=UPI003A8A07C9